jgi:membrane-bound serine protease (ClpP class)
MEDKLTNDAVATLRSIAQERGRDLEWVEAAVRQSRSSSAEEAVELKIADFIARDRDDLLRQAEGRQVKTVFGAAALSLKGKPLQELPVSLMEKILHQLAHPNLAYILLLLGIYGLIYELATPGAVFPGVVGAIFLVLALVALETLEVNWGGIALIALSLVFFVADIKLPGYGALTAGGIIAFALGSAILFPGVRIPHLKLPWTTIIASALLTAAFFLGIVGAGVRALRQKVTSGTEGLIGSEGLTKTDLRPSGMVHIKGEDWQARAKGFVRKGARVRVVRREGLTVHVEEVKEIV